MSIAHVVGQPYDLHPFPACRALDFLLSVVRVGSGSQRVNLPVFLARFAPARVVNRFTEIHAATLAQRTVKHHVCYVAHCSILLCARPNPALQGSRASYACPPPLTLYVKRPLNPRNRLLRSPANGRSISPTFRPRDKFFLFLGRLVLIVFHFDEQAVLST
jgi:hypothetical protein